MFDDGEAIRPSVGLGDVHLRWRKDTDLAGDSICGVLGWLLGHIMNAAN